MVVRTRINGCSAMASGGRPAALHVTDDTARHLRYTSRAKREADDSLSHRPATRADSDAASLFLWRILREIADPIRKVPPHNAWL